MNDRNDNNSEMHKQGTKMKLIDCSKECVDGTGDKEESTKDRQRKMNKDPKQ